MDPRLVAFLGVAALVIVTPGPDTALTIWNTLRGGRRGGLGTALGVATGQALWTVAVSAGVAAVLVASATAFAGLRLAGAAYLAWLGLQAMWAAFRPGDHTTARESDLHATERLAPAAAFRQGVVSNLGNPKMAVFFTSLLPQFAPEGSPSVTALLALGFLFCAMTLTWLAGYAVAIGKAGRVLARPRVRRALEGLTGAVLVALGLRLALASR